MVTTAEDSADALAMKAARGDARALERLKSDAWPFLLSYAKSLAIIRRLGSDGDHAHDVVVRVIEVMSKPAALATFADGGSFRSWVATVARNEAVGLARKLIGEKRDPSEGVSPKALLNLLATSDGLDHLGGRPNFTQQQLVAQVLEFAAARLSPEQQDVLGRWLEGQDDAEIGSALGWPPKKAMLVRRAAIARLRHEFAIDDVDFV